MATTQAKPQGFSRDNVQAQYTQWVKNQSPAVEVAINGLTSSAQGVFIGYLLGSMTSMDSSGGAAEDNPAMATQLKALQAGGPWAYGCCMAIWRGWQAFA